MKSGASRISKHISLLTIACQGGGRGVRAVTEQGTAVSPGPDHTQPGRRGFGKEVRNSRMSERFGRTSARYATRASLFLRRETSGSAGCGHARPWSGDCRSLGISRHKGNRQTPGNAAPVPAGRSFLSYFRIFTQIPHDFIYFRCGGIPDGQEAGSAALSHSARPFLRYGAE